MSHQGIALTEQLKANERYVSEFASTKKGSLALPPAKHVAWVVCMDARIDPAQTLGLQEGDAHVIRNAGGRFADAERSIVISQTLLGTNEVGFIHHTDCGMLTFTDDVIRKKLRSTRNVNADHMSFLPFHDIEQSVRDDIRAYHQSPATLKGIPVRGFVYDVKTGKLTEVADKQHNGV